MADLTTLAKVKSQLSIQATTGGQGTLNDDTLISEYVTQASQYIESYCKRPFSSSVGTLYYDSTYPTVFGSKLFFDRDILSVATLINGDGSTLTSSDYKLLPLNDSPKYAAQLINNYWTFGTSQVGAITVIGTIGYCVTGSQPADITLAATKLAAFLYQSRDNLAPQINVADGSINVPAEAQAMIMRILDTGRYVRDVVYT